jgi:hypothetical protein
MEGWFFVGYVTPRDYGLGSNQDPGSLVSPRRGDYYCCVEHTYTRVTSGSRVAWFSGCRLVASQGGKTPHWGARTALACLHAQYIASFNFPLFVGLSLSLSEISWKTPPRSVVLFSSGPRIQGLGVAGRPLHGCFLSYQAYTRPQGL